MTALEALQRAPLFKEFSEVGLATFAEIAQARTVPAGTPLFVEDEEGDALLLVVSGEVRLLQREPEGAQRAIGTAGPGAHLGALGLLAKTVHLCSAVAATDCEVLELPRREFFRKAQSKPVTCMKLAAVVAGELAARVGENRRALRDLALRGQG